MEKKEEKKVIRTSGWNKNVYKKMTFQIPATIARKFRKACMDAEVSMNMIIKQSMQTFTESVEKSTTHSA